MITYALFPTLVCEYNLPNHSEFNSMFMQNILKHLNENGRSDELTGHVSIHHDPNLKSLTEFIGQSVRQYMEVLKADHTKFNISIVKCWLNILGGTYNMRHHHGDAHISWVYYINIPEKVNNQLRFFNEKRYEPYPGFLDLNNTGEWNVFNSNSWRLVPEEGKLFVFPASLPHDTVQVSDNTNHAIRSLEDAKEKRIAIAGDIILSYKEPTAIQLGLQPISNWRTI